MKIQIYRNNFILSTFKELEDLFYHHQSNILRQEMPITLLIMALLATL
jgi:hypothetical protein